MSGWGVVSRVSAELNAFAFPGAQPAPMGSQHRSGRKCAVWLGNSSVHGKGVCEHGQTGHRMALGCRTAKVTLLLSHIRLTNVRKESRVGGAATQIRCTGLGQAEMAVYGEANFGRIGVVLPIVLPPADGAQLHGRRRFQRAIAAAWASKADGGNFHVEIDGKHSGKDYVLTSSPMRGRRSSGGLPPSRQSPGLGRGWRAEWAGYSSIGYSVQSPTEDRNRCVYIRWAPFACAGGG